MLTALKQFWSYFVPRSSISSEEDSEDKPAGLPVPNSSKSFWHTEPSEFLLGHRTTNELPEYADVVIIGSGITGTSAARFLSEDDKGKKLKVLMLEAREACWGATGRNGGHCQPLLFDRSAEVALFELKNYDTVRSYISDNNVPCEWRTVTGCRTLWTPELLKDATSEVEQLKKDHPDIGARVSIITDPEDLKKHRIAGNAGCSGATLTNFAGSLWPYKYVAFILEKLVRSGFLNLQTSTPVKKLSVVSHVNDKARWVLHTDRGEMRARHVIIATNGYTSHIVHEFADLILPVRGEMSALLPPLGSARLPDSYGFVGAQGGDANRDDYLIQRPFEGVPNAAGHLMFGGGSAWAKLNAMGETDDSVIDEGAAKYLRTTLLEMMELGGTEQDVQELKAANQWTGIMGYSRDNHPWVGALPGKKGLWMSAGYTGHGMPNGTLCGKAVVDMLLADENGADMAKVQQDMVEKGDIPKLYLLTQERIDNARALPTVKTQYDEGHIGNFEAKQLNGNVKRLV
ncbi:FAD dependent oxidoreductase-like protein [Rhizodiscina lignyota]|uniref:FAD dependent oxidoreductase-like protein n=1 Tax=Rhizodiscina lignyota TaxID=1504668 RepID=A0A9P4IRI7_9PEZI|nr:FAD dependent oxidoreductase-like protein [Rhizodiscina lignyota]